MKNIKELENKIASAYCNSIAVKSFSKMAIYPISTAFDWEVVIDDRHNLFLVGMEREKPKTPTEVVKGTILYVSPNDSHGGGQAVVNQIWLSNQNPEKKYTPQVNFEGLMGSYNLDYLMCQQEYLIDTYNGRWASKW